MNVLANKKEKFSSNSRKINLNKKRITLHVIWAIINLTVLSFCFYKISGSDWETVFLISMFFYCSVYWMVASIIFDKLTLK